MEDPLVPADSAIHRSGMSILTTLSSIHSFVILNVLIHSMSCKHNIKIDSNSHHTYGMVYIDMDGTLLDSEHRVRQDSLVAISKYRSCGGLIGIASGRTVDQVMPYLSTIGIDLPLVLYNGAVTYNPSGTTILQRNGLSIDVLDTVLSAIESEGENINGALAHYDTGETLADRSTAALMAFAAEAHIAITETCELGRCVMERASQLGITPAKVLVLTDPEAVADVQLRLDQALRPHARAVVGNGRDGVIEVLGISTSKAAAIQDVRDQLGLSGILWAAIGDSQNDVEMVSTANLGVAMGNCHPSTCGAADIIIGTNEDNSIYTIFRKKFIGPQCRSLHGQR